MGKWKTYKILRTIDEDYKSIEDKEFKLISIPVDYEEVCELKIGDVVYVSNNFYGKRLFFKKNNLPLKVKLSGFEEWEELVTPLTFMEAIKEGNRLIKVEHPCIEQIIHEEGKSRFTQMNYLDNFLYELSTNFNTFELREILKEGKFYVE